MGQFRKHSNRWVSFHKRGWVNFGERRSQQRAGVGQGHKRRVGRNHYLRRMRWKSDPNQSHRDNSMGRGDCRLDRSRRSSTRLRPCRCCRCYRHSPCSGRNPRSTDRYLCRGDCSCSRRSRCLESVAILQAGKGLRTQGHFAQKIGLPLFDFRLIVGPPTCNHKADFSQMAIPVLRQTTKIRRSAASNAFPAPATSSLGGAFYCGILHVPIHMVCDWLVERLFLQIRKFCRAYGTTWHPRGFLFHQVFPPFSLYRQKTHAPYSWNSHHKGNFNELPSSGVS